MLHPVTDPFVIDVGSDYIALQVFADDAVAVVSVAIDDGDHALITLTPEQVRYLVEGLTAAADTADRTVSPGKDPS